jgi:hypothetical protein
LFDLDYFSEFEYKRIFDLDYFEKTFVSPYSFSSSRRMIFNDYLRYSKKFAEEYCYQWIQWIDGSFITDKLNPNDIDVVNFIQYSEALEKRKNDFNQFKRKFGSIANYQTDGFLVILDNIARKNVNQNEINYWQKIFSTTRNNERKVFFEIKLNQTILERYFKKREESR